ncbi:hypothetical protein M3J09_013503 [Ascochyta lentis]
MLRDLKSATVVTSFISSTGTMRFWLCYMFGSMPCSARPSAVHLTPNDEVRTAASVRDHHNTRCT